MNQQRSIKTLIQLSLITAITVALSLLIHIPIPGTTGVITLIDVGIYMAGFLFGPVAGMIVGAVSGLLFDFFSGYAIWIPISIVAHGLQGYLFGYFIKKDTSQSHRRFILASVIAGIAMVALYFIGEALLFQTIGAAITQLPFNVIQVSVASIVIFQLHLFKHFGKK